MERQEHDFRQSDAPPLHSSRGFKAGQHRWIPISRSLGLILRRKRLFGWSCLLVLVTIALTWMGYQFSVDVIDKMTTSYLPPPPDGAGIWNSVKTFLYSGGKWLFSFLSHLLAFYVSFLLAYTLTSPGYSFLSSSAEKIYAGEHFDPDVAFTLAGGLVDIYEGVKIGLFGVLITIVAFFVNFIPAIGQAVVILCYIYYSALLFIDYPASRRRWSLGRKLHWLRDNSSTAFRLGLLPALLSMVPLLNIFFIAMLFPLLTVHATLNFTETEMHG